MKAFKSFLGLAIMLPMAGLGFLFRAAQVGFGAGMETFDEHENKLLTKHPRNERT